MRFVVNFRNTGMYRNVVFIFYLYRFYCENKIMFKCHSGMRRKVYKIVSFLFVIKASAIIRFIFLIVYIKKDDYN